MRWSDDEFLGEVTVPPDLLDAWGQLWTNRSEPYAVQQEDGTYRWVYKPADATVLSAHLGGTSTIALSSLGEDGSCRWLCLDADQSDALPQLLELASALAEVGLPGLVEASRRGGHLWLLLDAPILAAVVRRLLLHELDDLRAAGLAVPTFELYPDAEVAGTLGHAVRLPFGLHRLTGRRYALFDEQCYPCAFTSTDAALRFVLAWPRASVVQLIRRAGELVDGGRVASNPHDDRTPPESLQMPLQIGTRSAVIRWVDAHVAIPDLLAEIAPTVELKRVGRGYLGWCPFHDDRSPDDEGRPGTPSFYAVRDRRYGWSWRCYSTNCSHSGGLLRHSFRLLQDLLELTVSQAIREACARWPEADVRAKDDSDEGIRL